MIGQFQHNTSVELRENKEFMMQAVALNGILYFAAEAKLRRDVDLAIVAFSSDQNLIGFRFDYMEQEEHYEEEIDFNSDVKFLRRVREIARSRIQNHRGFLEGFLPGMSADATNDSTLSILVKGPETTLAFKRLIAEFVGFPIVRLAQHKKTVTSLRSIPEQTSSCNCVFCRMFS
jgi:hypothetical protein